MATKLLTQYHALRAEALANIITVCKKIGKHLEDSKPNVFAIKLDWNKVTASLPEGSSYYRDVRSEYIIVENEKVWLGSINTRSNAESIDADILFALCDYLNSKRGA